MEFDERERLSDTELVTFFDRLFPEGLAARPDIGILGACLWDIFSDNNEVIAADGRLIDLGTFRGTSEFLDAYIAGRRVPPFDGDSARFYMATVHMKDVDLTPAFLEAFARLRAAGATWRFSGRMPDVTPDQPLHAIFVAHRAVYGGDPELLR